MSLGTSVTQSGAVKPSSLEQEVFDPTIQASRYVEIPSNLQAQYAYDTDGKLLYAGFAVRALAVGTDGWLLQKFTYNASKQVATRTIAYSNWTGRTTATYA